MKDKKVILIIILSIIVIIYVIPSVYTTFAGSHTIEKNRNSSSLGYASLCNNCHNEEVALNNLSGHRGGCICHGYAPSFNINEKHNLSVNLYCTNCHANYDVNGSFEIHRGEYTSNQSAHYIMKNSSMWVEHAKKFFH